MSKLVSQLVKMDLKASYHPDNIYVDLSCVNNNVNQQVPLQFSHNRNSAICDDPQNYYLTVLKFNIPTNTVPVMCVSIQTGQSDVNKSIYSFTFKKGNNVYQSYLSFIAQDKSASSPTVPTTNQDISTGYYYLYNFSWFVDLLNNTLQSAITGLKGLDGTVDDSTPPYFLFDPSSEELVLSCPQLAFDLAGNTPIEIYCNTQMYNMLSSFKFQYQGINVLNGMNYKFDVKNQYGTNIYQTTDDVNYIQLYQEYNTTSLWNYCTGIVLCSSTLPILETAVSAPQVYGNSSFPYDQNNNVSQPIISDMSLSLEKGSYRPGVYYIPTSQYRLIDLFGHSDIRNIQISVYWRTKYSQLIPLMLNADSSAYIKIGILAKCLFNNSQ